MAVRCWHVVVPRAASVCLSESPVTQHGFPRQVRLLRPGDYRFVFDAPLVKVPLPELLLLARPNTLGHPRIGVIVSKKASKRAVHRNRFKRLVREFFRHNQASLPALDIICIARQDAMALDNPVLTRRLAKAFRKLNERYERTRSEG
ncbi:MAG: ribonuclease P protein component [Gammaproteobacteria bacterium]|nr:MAG: ribonuclease P protein component [Gammaproteobacteria bacterium]